MNLSKKILSILATPLLIVFLVLVFALTIRGHIGNPTEATLNDPTWHGDGPFELSPERGRFALTFSYVENKSFYFSVPVARFATPDLGYANGRYVSLFAPAISFLVMPGYIVGRYFNASQVGSFAVISLFAVFNALLVRAIAIKLGASKLAGSIGGIIFVFATPAFTYGVTLYQHHVSTFLILSSLYLLFRWKNWFSTFAVWFLFAMSIPVDYPNLILMGPIAIYALGRMLWFEKTRRGISFSLNLFSLLTPIAVVIPLAFYVWFSMGSYQKPLQLAGTVTGVPTINAQGKPANSNAANDSNVSQTVNPNSKPEKSAVGFFLTRNMLNGFYIHTVSPDRGIFFFTPIVLFGILGGFVLWRTKQKELALIVAIIGADFILYSMWGDPWGGWGFGSRYLIPAYSMSAILVSMAVSKYHKNILFVIPFVLIGIYSIAVNSLGAVTTSANPPKVQVLALEKQTGIPQKYTVEKNYDYLMKNGTKSFVFGQFLKNKITPVEYYLIVTSLITLVFGFGVIRLAFKK